MQWGDHSRSFSCRTGTDRMPIKSGARQKPGRSLCQNTAEIIRVHNKCGTDIEALRGAGSGVSAASAFQQTAICGGFSRELQVLRIHVGFGIDRKRGCTQVAGQRCHSATSRRDVCSPRHSRQACSSHRSIRYECGTFRVRSGDTRTSIEEPTLALRTISQNEIEAVPSQVLTTNSCDRAQMRFVGRSKDPRAQTPCARRHSGVVQLPTTEQVSGRSGPGSAKTRMRHARPARRRSKPEFRERPISKSWKGSWDGYAFE